MNISSIGIDLGKTTFHLVALNECGRVVVRKKFSRKALLAYTANLQNSLIGIEACSGAHFIGSILRNQGHDVRLIPAQFVKPFVKSNKNGTRHAVLTSDDLKYFRDTCPFDGCITCNSVLFDPAASQVIAAESSESPCGKTTS